MPQQQQGDTTPQSRIKRLAIYAPALHRHGTHWVEVSPPRGSGTAADPYIMGSGGPYLTKAALDFIEMLYEAGWVLQDFDWSAWAAAAEGRAFLSNPANLASATELDLAMVLTTLAHMDRFSEGTLANAFQSGLIRAAAERSAELASV